MKCQILLIVGILFKIALRANGQLLSLLGAQSARDDWRTGVKKCCDGVERVVQTFPEPTYDFGQNIYSSFCAQVDNLQNLANCSEPILSNRSINILNALNLLSNVDTSPSNLLYQLEKTLPDKTLGYCTSVTNLNATIGKLDRPVNQVVNNVQDCIKTCLKQFNRRFLVRKQQRSEKIDFKELVKSARFNSFTIAFIAETAINSADTIAPECLQAVAILTFISNLQVLAVHGTNANMGSILVSETDNVSPYLRSCFDTLDPLIVDITNLISSASFDSVDKNTEYLRNYINTINSYKRPLETLLGPFEGVKITEAQVIANLAKE